MTDKYRKLSNVALAGVLVAIATVVIARIDRSRPSANPAKTGGVGPTTADNRSAALAIAPEFDLQDLSGELSEALGLSGQSCDCEFLGHLVPAVPYGDTRIPKAA
jgi:hypothetical protein